ncbi:MAG: hypothetical protein AAGF81_22650, partial [Pseudomonadota bacterium]
MVHHRILYKKAGTDPLPKTPSELDALTEQLIAFRDAREWRQFHSLKNLIISLNLEATELLELTQWKSDEDIEAAIGSPEFSEKAAEECA